MVKTDTIISLGLLAGIGLAGYWAYTKIKGSIPSIPSLPDLTIPGFGNGGNGQDITPGFVEWLKGLEASERRLYEYGEKTKTYTDLVDQWFSAMKFSTLPGTQVLQYFDISELIKQLTKTKLLTGYEAEKQQQRQKTSQKPKTAPRQQALQQFLTTSKISTAPAPVVAAPAPLKAQAILNKIKFLRG